MEHTSYKLINIRPLVAGIEHMQAVVICLVFIVFFFLTSSFLFVLVLCSALYLVAKLLMANKPRNWMEDVFAYQLGTKVYAAVSERGEE